jgi:hypothetical protein
VCYFDLAKYCVCGHRFGDIGTGNLFEMLKNIVKESNHEKTK